MTTPHSLRGARASCAWMRLPTLVLVAVIAVGCEIATTETNDPFDEGAPVAAFDQDQTRGAPGLVVQFSNTSEGSVSSYLWDFGALGTSTAVNPQVTFPTAGVYSVTLTATGPSGMSTIEKTDLISIGAVVVGGFTCDPLVGYTPLTVTCTDASQNADTWLWNFGDGASSTDQNPTHDYTTAGDYTLQQTASGPAGSAMGSVSVQVRDLRIDAAPASGGSAPVVVTFQSDTGGLPANTYRWVVDGVIVGSLADLTHQFLNPGTFAVSLLALDLATGISALTSISYTVGYGPATADFAPMVTGGDGPLQVPFADMSAGQIDKWDWDFGDGSQCVFPDQGTDPPYDVIPVCDAASPNHVYAAIGSYDVTLTVTGPAATPGSPDVTSTFTLVDAVRVFINDPSFELQIPGTDIGGDWTSLRPAGLTQTGIHLTQSGTQDFGMPTEGGLWAMIDGIETDGTTPVVQLDNGIRQQFLLPPTRTVLEFDYALLFGEPPASGSADGVTATVSDGTTTVEIASAVADTTAAYAGQSVKFPMRDGNVVRVTPPRTASIDIAQAFPTAPDLTLFTLTIRVGNADDGFRSPRAYVDNVRFSAATPDVVTSNFMLPAGFVVAGQSTTFTDTSCVGAVGPTCTMPSSWRWDFGTGQLTAPPPASGSAAQDPTYVFPAAGTYLVQLTARFANQEDTVGTSVSVIAPLVPGFSITSPSGGQPFTAPVDISFVDTSTSDALDPIVSWVWDFGGWGTPQQKTEQNPTAVAFGQAGSYTVTLTITTQSGLTANHQLAVTLQ